MATIQLMVRDGNVSAGICGLHTYNGHTEDSGWVQLEVGPDTLTIHADDIGALCNQLVTAARQCEQMIADEISEQHMAVVEATICQKQ